MVNYMRYLYFLLLLLASAVANAQNVGINTDGSLPDPSAMLDVKSSNKGMLLPRVALTGTNDNATVISPQVSLIVYNTSTAGSGITKVTPGFYFWDGTSWVRLTAGGNGWSLNGNAGTTPGSNFIGTTDNTSLQFRVNNQLAGHIDVATLNTSLGYMAANSI